MKIAPMLVIASLAAAAGCGGSSDSSGSSNPSNPTSPGSPSACRTYPTAATVTVTAAGITQNANLTGSFNTSTNQATITVLFTTGTLCSTAIHTYRAKDDFVDEVRVIPPVPLVLSTMTTNGGACGTGTGTVTNIYDSQRRLTQVTGPTGTTTYTAWDASGRPTTGSFPGATISNVYNDAARTLTQTQVANGTTTVSTQSFDANGAQTQVVTTTGGISATTTFTNTSTAQVCK